MTSPENLKALQDAALLMRLTIDKYLHGVAGRAELVNAQYELERARVNTLLYGVPDHKEETYEPT